MKKELEVIIRLFIFWRFVVRLVNEELFEGVGYAGYKVCVSTAWG